MAPPKAAALALGAALGGCASSAPVLSDSAPAQPPPGLALLPDPEVRADPKSKRGNDPYVVHGKRYQVLDSAAGYVRDGIASWYGTKFHRLATSSGEIYDMYQLTAAHRTLPIPTYVRVTNLDNGKSIIVRVNDRGPFHPQRIIDLSYAAAVKLGFDRIGTARVRVESALPAPEEKRPAAKLRRRSRFFVQAGPFAHQQDAYAAREKLPATALHPAFVVAVNGAFAVRIGPLSQRRDAQRLEALLTFHELATSIVEE